MGYQKKERKHGMPKKHDPKKEKKIDTSMSMKKREEEKKKKKNIPMYSCYPNKGERDP